MLDITVLPSAKVPLFYEGTTLMSTEWYRFFWNVYGFTGSPTGAIPVNKGGTGLTTIGEHEIIIGNANNVYEPALLRGFGINVTYAPGFVNLSLGASGVTPGTYGNASTVGQFTIDQYGVITFADNIPIAIAASQIVSGQLPVIYGGTGASTAGGARANLSAAVLGANNDITSMTALTGGISSPDFIQFDTTYATTLTAGQLGWDGNNTLGIGMAGGNVIQHIGEDQFFYCKATSAITKGQVVMFTGAVGASGVPTGAPATGITDGTYIMGIAAENIANNGFGLVQSFGTLRNVNTSGYADGDILWYNPAVAGGLTKTKPVAPNVKAQMAAVINGGSAGGGTILIRINPGSILGGTDSNAEITSPANGNILTYDGANSYWKNTVLTAGSGVAISTSATGVLTVSATGSGGTVTSVSGTAPISVATGTTTPVISISQATTSTDGYLSSTDWNTFNNKQPAGTYVTSISIASSNGFTGTSSGGATPALTLATSVTGILKGNGTAISAATSGTDYAPATSGTSILYGNGAGGFSNVTIGTGVSFAGGTLSATGTGGTVTSVAALTLGTTGTDLSSTVANGTTTPVITLNVPTASATNRGALSSTDWSTFNGKQAALVSGTNIKTVGGVSLLGSGDVGIISGTYGGTGVNNGSKTITLGGNLTTSGAFNTTLTVSANTSLTLPVSGTVISTVTNMAANPVTGTPSASNFLRGDGTWAVPVAGSGTVTSVAMSVPSFLSVAGSPITTSGTLAVTLSGTALPVANGGTGSTTSTGSGSVVLATSPTIASPIITGSTPSVTVYTSGSGTYTTPTNARWLQIIMVGAGGGGSGGYTGAVGGAGGNTTFGSNTAYGGGGGGLYGGQGTGGNATLSGATGISVYGGFGQGGIYLASNGNYFIGGSGGATALGGVGTSSSAGAQAGKANTGSGGGGGVCNNVGYQWTGGGGGGGGFINATITSPSATYSYAVGAGGSGGANGGSGGTDGATGGSGVIYVIAYF